MNQIETKIENELFDTTSQLLENYSELAIDAFLSDGIVKDIPVVSTLYSVYKIANTISNAKFIKNMLMFLQLTKTSLLYSQDSIKLKEYFDKKKDKKDFIDKTLFCLDKIEDTWKNKLLSSVFIAMCNFNLAFDEFSFIVEYINSSKKFEFNILSMLYDYSDKEGKTLDQLFISGLNKNMINAGILNLLNNGLIEEFGTVYFGKSENIEKKYAITNFGSKVYDYLNIRNFA